jgi:hypothetical protein
MKACIIITIGWLFAGNPVIFREFVGVLMAIGGAIGYTFASIQAPK